jgi:hypothetical protein
MGDYDLWDCPQCGEPRACISDELFPNGSCNLHGGKARRGKQSKRFKHGKYSQYSYAAAWQKMGLGELHSEIDDSDIYDARESLRSLAARARYLLHTGLGSELYEQITKWWRELKEANREKDEDRQRAAFAVLDELIEKRSLVESRQWREYYDVEDQIDKMRDRVQKRAIQVGVLVERERVQASAITLAHATQTEIEKFCERLGLPDWEADDLLQRIEDRFAELLGRRLPKRVAAAAAQPPEEPEG